MLITSHQVIEVASSKTSGLGTFF